jgi:RND family efflux transporter MFP subunit
MIARLLLLSLAALSAGCAAKADAASKASPPPPEVQTIVAHAGTIAPSMQIAGVIAPYRQVAVTANLSEPLSEVDVVEGDRVRAGQVLARQLTDDLQAQLVSSERVVSEDEARLSQTTYSTTATTGQNLSAVASARDTLRQAQVTLSGAETDLRRYAALVTSGYIPAQTVDQQRVTVESDRQAVAAARASLEAALINNAANGNGQNAGAQQQDIAAAQQAVDAANASVDQLKLEIARAVITAPVAGVVESVNANPGEYPSGRQLFTIEQNDKVYALLPTSTAQVLSVHRGAGATVEINTSQQANPQYHKDRGTVDAVLDQIEPGTTNFTVKVLLDNADAHLHAGMPVNGFVDLPPTHGIEVPMTAFIDDTRTTLYTVDDDVVHQKTVNEVAEDGANAIVTGVANGERVVANVSTITVGNGDRVSIASPQPQATK